MDVNRLLSSGLINKEVIFDMQILWK